MTAKCPACAKSPIFGMVLKPARDGRQYFQPCDPCGGRGSIELLSSEQAKLAAVWMPPKDVAGFKASLANK